jgi:phosphoglycolate phosphatase-like HAD superfamily hydrolase
MSDSLSEKKIVLFDVDGTLVDNSELSVASTLYAFEKVFSLGLNPDEYDFLNMRFSNSIPKILDNKNIPLDPSDLEDYVSQIMECKREFSGSKENYNLIQLAPGTNEILEYLRKQRVLIGVASNGFEENIKLMLKELGILNRFDYVHAESDLSLQKPNHAPILKVMNELATQSGIAYREFVKNSSLMVGDTPKKDQVAVQNYNSSVGLTNPDFSPMDFALVDLSDPGMNNEGSHKDVLYLGGNLMSLRNLL